MNPRRVLLGNDHVLIRAGVRALLVLVWASPSGVAQTAVETPRSIRVVMDNNYAPYSFQSDEGKLEGILIDQWQEWEKKTGIQVDLHTMDWGEALRRMRAGEFDAIDCIVETAERRDYFDFTAPYATVEASIYFRTDISGITGLASLKGFPVGVKTGDQHIDQLKANGVTTVMLFPNNDAILEAAKQRKINVFLVDNPSALYLLHKMGMEEEFRHSAPVFRDDLRRAVRKGDATMLRTVSEGFSAIEPGELKQIEEKWFGRPINRLGRYLTYLGYAAAAAILLIAGLAGWNLTLKKKILQRTSALSESEQRFRRLIELMPVAIYVCDTSGLIQIYNHRAVELWGREPKPGDTAQLYCGSLRLYSPGGELVPHEKSWMAEALRTGVEARDLEVVMERPDGSCITVLVNIAPLRNGGGQLVGAMNCFQDITERKRDGALLHAREQEFRAIVENAPDQIIRYDREFRRTYVNPAVAKAYGLSAEALTSKPIGSVIQDAGLDIKDEELSQVRQQIKAVFETGQSSEYEMKWPLPTGRRYFNVRLFPELDLNGSVINVLGITRDITERRQAEEKLKQSESQLAEAQRLAHVGSWSLDLRSNTVTWSDELYRMFGVEPSEFDHRYEAVVDTTHPGDRDLIRSIIENAVKTREPFSAYYRMTRADGEVRVLHAHGTVVIDEDGNVRTMHGAAQDVTERKEAEERLRRSEEKFKALFDLAPVGIAVLDQQRNVLDANPALAQIMRLPREELLRRGHLGRTVLNVDGTPMPPHDFPTARALRENRPISNAEAGLVLENGETVWLQLSVALLALPDMSAVVVTQDITERRCAEEELKREKEILAKIFNNIPVMIGFVGTDGSVRLVNPEWERTIGWTLKELQEQNVDIFEEAYPDLSYRQEILDFVAAATGEWADLKIKVRDGRVIDAACAIVHLSDGTKVAIAQDISERKRAARELEAANYRLRDLSRRLFEVQEEERRHLARELHDEIGQALTAAKITLQSITGHAGSPTVARVQETTAILDRLLGQVRQISLDLRPSMLDDLGLIPALRSLVDQQGRRASVEMRFSAETLPETIDTKVQTTCFRIAQEAITNALRHAHATHVEIDLRRDDDTLRLVIRDNGTGFDAESAQAKTLGLGLIGMKERAALVGGRAKIISSPNKGTTIEVSIPLIFSTRKPGSRR